MLDRYINPPSDPCVECGRIDCECELCPDCEGKGKVVFYCTEPCECGEVVDTCETCKGRGLI